MTERDAKTVALEALRAWRDLDGDRDRLVAAADSAGASRTAIAEASGLHRNTVASILDSQEDSMTAPTATRAGDLLAGLHHPNYVSHRFLDTKRHFPQYEFKFRPFTGTEPEPVNIDGAEGPQFVRDLMDTLGRDVQALFEQAPGGTKDTWYSVLVWEYWFARSLWAVAKFKYAARALLEEAAPIWEAYAGARQRMEALFDQFRDLADDRWHSQTLKLIEAQEQTEAAARDWDRIAVHLARIEAEHRADRTMSPDLTGIEHASLADAAAAAGIDSEGWVIAEPREYVLAASDNHATANHTPVHGDVLQAVTAQLARLKQVRQALAATEGA